MADPNEAPVDDPFASILSDKSGAPEPPEDNPFSAIMPQPVQTPVSTMGAFRRGAQRSAAPAVTGLAAMGAGAEAGAAAGGALSVAFPPAAPILIPGGAIVGGLAGMIGGSMAGEAAQNWALSQLPDSWRDALGMDERQQRLDEAQHPVASFVGGLVPYAVTMKPGGFTRSALPDNATAIQRLMEHPATAKLFGGAVMGGMELGTEAIHGEYDWRKVAIATGFGVVWNKPTRLGQGITEWGAAPTRAGMEAAARPFSVRGTEVRPEEFRGDWSEAYDRTATVAKVGDAKVIGPGVTEDVFQGTHEQNPSAAMTAQETARTEQAVLGAPPQPDLHVAVRQLEPELFSHYDALAAQREEVSQWIRDESNPPDEHLADLRTRQEALQAQLDAHVAERAGYAGGPEARRLRAQIRDLEREQERMLGQRHAFLEGRGEETAALAMARKHFLELDAKIQALAPEVSAAYRRASEPGVAREAPPPPAPAPAEQTAPAAQEAPAAPPAAPAGPDPIVADVTRQLLAAGRPAAEAEATARLAAAYYRTRAARFGGVLGTAEELYQREGATIQGTGRPARAALPDSLAANVANVAKVPAAPESPAPAAPTIPKGYEAWTPGATVKVGPIAGMTVVGREGDAFILRKGSKTYEFTPPEKPPKEKTGLEMLEHLREVEARELAQPERDLSQGALGKIRIRNGQRSIITLMQDANASTPIHELGHDFFDQMMRDAEHPQAPDQLRDDAQTLYDALKVNGREEVKPRHEEKIARWFEQYMREGRAPSPELASVFAQFKSWLLDIYRTIKELGTPISPDVRKVFDRMLVEEPQRTVIAPEREAGPTIHDIHAADAIHTEPAEAEPVMDRVIAEATRSEAEPPPEIAHEIEAVIAKTEAAQPAGENGAGAGAAAEVEPGGERPQPQPGGSVMGTGDEPVVASRGAAGGEGASVSGSEQRRGGGNEPPLAPGPGRVFDATDSPNVDKAGNIRVENLTNVQELADAIHASAARNNDFIGVRGRMTEGQKLDLAEAVGLRADQIDEQKLGALFGGIDQLAPKIWALRDAIIESAGIVVRAAKKATESNATEDIAKWIEAYDRHDMMQSTLSKVTTEMGRGLGMGFRDMTGVRNAKTADELNAAMKSSTGRTLFQMKQIAKMASTMDNPAAVSKFLRDANKRSFGRMALEYWINGLISGPATHATYMMGNTILALQKMGPETALAATIGKLRSGLGREGETVRMGEVLASLRGAASGFMPAAQASIESMRTGVTALLPGQTRGMAMPFQPGAELVVPPTLNEAARAADVMASTFGMIRGLRDGFIAAGEAFKVGGGIEGAPLVGAHYTALGAIPDLAVRGVPVLPIGSTLRLPSRAIAGIHTFFRSMNYSIEKNALAYRAASSEGLSGTAFDARVAQLRENPLPSMMETAAHEATELTLMGQGSKFTQALGRLTNTEVFGFPILKFIDPFVHISSNVIDQSIIRRTPVGILSPELRADLMGRNGTVAQDKAQARMLVGSAFALTVGGLAAEGLASGSGPSEPREAAMWRLAGNQAHSVRIGDMWYDTHRLGPVGMLMSIGADMYDVAHEANKGEFTKAAAHFQHAITQNILDESFMRGPSDLIRAVESPGRYGEAYIRNFLSSFVPFSVGMGQTARAVDPYAREARTVVDAMKNKVPGLSTTLLPRRDIWGDPIENKEALIAKGITAIYEQKISTDPVNLAMLQLGVFPTAVDRKIRNVELTDEQHDDYARIAGKIAKARLDVIVQNPQFTQLPPSVRHDVMRETIRQSRETASGAIMAKDPTILQRAYQDKVERVTAPEYKKPEVIRRPATANP